MTMEKSVSKSWSLIAEESIWNQKTHQLTTTHEQASSIYTGRGGNIGRIFDTRLTGLWVHEVNKLIVYNVYEKEWSCFE